MRKPLKALLERHLLRLAACGLMASFVWHDAQAWDPAPSDNVGVYLLDASGQNFDLAYSYYSAEANNFVPNSNDVTDEELGLGGGGSGGGILLQGVAGGDETSLNAVDDGGGITLNDLEAPRVLPRRLVMADPYRRLASGFSGMYRVFGFGGGSTGAYTSRSPTPSRTRQHSENNDNCGVDEMLRNQHVVSNYVASNLGNLNVGDIISVTLGDGNLDTYSFIGGDGRATIQLSMSSCHQH